MIVAGCGGYLAVLEWFDPSSPTGRAVGYVVDGECMDLSCVSTGKCDVL